MSLTKEQMIAEIEQMKKEQNAVIVAHYYQNDEVQDVADIVGDSYGLSVYCADNVADTIVFCGVGFMAESAKILSPDKTVLIPELRAGCPMADMVTGDDVKLLRRQYPGAAIVCYVNTSAETKAECDVCCTSSNAVKIVRALKEKQIVFLPDKNLGSFVAKQVPEKEVILYDGFCYTHNKIRMDEVDEVMNAHPDAKLAVHPECQSELVERSDFAGSTAQIIEYCSNSVDEKFIIGTEMGILYELKKRNPKKTFYILSPRFVCPNMKYTRLSSVYEALKKRRYEMEVDEDIRIRAIKSLDRMIEITQQN
jgi:quinolinate synthase